jgi:hypothetical protein
VVAKVGIWPVATQPSLCASVLAKHGIPQVRQASVYSLVMAFPMSSLYYQTKKEKNIFDDEIV